MQLQRLEQIAAIIYARDDAISDEMGMKLLLRGKDEPHYGDCEKAENQVPMTCMRCVYDDGIAFAKKIVDSFNSDIEVHPCRRLTIPTLSE